MPSRPPPPVKADFILGGLFDHPYLTIPQYCNLTEKEQEDIREVITTGPHRVQRKAWYAKTESEKFVHSLSRLFRNCAFHKFQYRCVEFTRYWGKAMKSMGMIKGKMVTKPTIRRLVLVLFAAREEYKRRTHTSAGDTDHELSQSIDKFYLDMEDFLGEESFSQFLTEMAINVPQYPSDEEGEKKMKDEDGDDDGEYGDKAVEDEDEAVECEDEAVEREDENVEDKNKEHK